jgi:hypothetical protein
VALFRSELFPASGLDVAEAEHYVDVCAAVDALSGEISAVVVNYLEGEIDRDEAGGALRERALMEHPESTLAFVDRYRAYALAYTIGRDWLQPDLAQLGSDRWTNLARLMVSPPR